MYPRLCVGKLGSISVEEKQTSFIYIFHLYLMWTIPAFAKRCQMFHQSRDQDTTLYIYGLSGPGPRLNIKTVLSTYGDFHVKDKTAVRTSYL